MAPVRCPGQNSAVMSRASVREFCQIDSKLETPSTSRAYLWVIVKPIFVPLALKRRRGFPRAYWLIKLRKGLHTFTRLSKACVDNRAYMHARVLAQRATARGACRVALYKEISCSHIMCLLGCHYVAIISASFEIDMRRPLGWAAAVYMRKQMPSQSSKDDKV